jgi:hypothetical protein
VSTSLIESLINELENPLNKIKKSLKKEKFLRAEFEMKENRARILSERMNNVPMF